MNSSLQTPRIATHSRHSSRDIVQLESTLRYSEPQHSIPLHNHNQQEQTGETQNSLERDLLQTRGSFCSRGSRRSSRYSTTSRSSWYHQLDDFSSMPLARLTDLLDGLLSLRIDYMSKGETEAQDQSIISDINRKLQLIKRVIMSRDREELTPQMYSLIDDKIEMIDKIMAEQWVQSEYVKKKFNAVISKSTSNNRYGEHERRGSCARIKQFMNAPPERVDTTTIPSPKTTLVAETRYKSEYQSPNHESIKLYKIPKRKYVPDYAPIPSSNYKSEYFDYKALTKPSIDNYKDTSNLSLGYHKAKFSSNYKSEYIDGQGTRDDYRELDCYKDKIRTLKLMFISKKPGPTKEQLSKSLANRSKGLFSPKSNLTSLKAYDGQFLSNNKNDYKLPSIFCTSKPKYNGVQSKRLLMKYRSLKNRYNQKQNQHSPLQTKT